MGQLICGQLILGQLTVVPYVIGDPLWVTQCRDDSEWIEIDRQKSDIQRCNKEVM